MSRLSQVFWFLNAEQLPTIEEEEFIYTDIQITPELIKKWERRHPEQGGKRQRREV